MSPSHIASSPAIQTATPSSVRAVNRSIILALIRQYQSVSRAELARLTGIFRSSISEIVEELLEANLLLEERGIARRGRTPMNLSLNDDYRRVLGLRIHSEFCEVAEAGLSGKIQHVLRFATPAEPEQLVQRFVSAVNHLEFRVDTRLHEGYRRVGIAVPGHVDVETGRLLWIPGMPQFEGYAIVDAIQEQTGIDALADNDSNVGALSEMWLRSSFPNGNHKGDFVFLAVTDHGVGAGLIIAGGEYRGHNSRFVGEFGHMVVEVSGTPCECGRQGCWERYICNAATWQRFRPDETFTSQRFEVLLTAALSGDARATEAVQESARFLAIGIANVAYALNPAAIVLGGKITALWDLLAPELQRVSDAPDISLDIRPAMLPGDGALLHGAVCLALQDIFVRPVFG